MALFFGGALIGSFGTYGTVGLASWLVPAGIARVIIWITVVTSVLWYLSQRRIHTFALSGRQAKRRRAQSGPGGLIYFGFILGVGLVTEMSTPLVLCGFASCLLGGLGYGVSYGVGFAAGRSWPAFRGVIAGPAAPPGAIVERLYFSHVTWRICFALLVVFLYIGTALWLPHSPRLLT